MLLLKKPNSHSGRQRQFAILDLEHAILPTKLPLALVRQVFTHYEAGAPSSTKTTLVLRTEVTWTHPVGASFFGWEADGLRLRNVQLN